MLTAAGALRLSYRQCLTERPILVGQLRFGPAFRCSDLAVNSSRVVLPSTVDLETDLECYPGLAN